MENEGNLKNYRNIQHYGFGSVYTTTYICQDQENYILKIDDFLVSKKLKRTD